MKFTALFALSAAALISGGQAVNLSQQTKVSAGIKEATRSQEQTPSGAVSSAIYNNSVNAATWETNVGYGLQQASGNYTQAASAFTKGENQVYNALQAVQSANTNIASASSTAQAGLTAANAVQAYITQAQTLENQIPALL